MKNLKHVWFIAIKNLRLFVTDRTALIMFILFPFLFIVMFNLLMNNAGSGDERITLRLATQETEGLSVQIIQAMETQDESTLAAGSPIIIWEKDYAQAKADVEAKKIDGFLGFPVDFTQNIMSGKGARLEIVSQAESTNTRMALQGLADSLASIFNTNRTVLHTVAAVMTQQGASQQDIQKAIAQISQRQLSTAGSATLITSQVEKVGEVKPFNASSFVVPGYLVMFVFFAAAIASIDIIQERRNHTLERLLASSVKKESILGGIYLGAVFRGLVQIIIFWAMGILVFHVDLGVSPWAVMVLSILMVLMSAAFSVMLATIVKTERGASALAVLCSLLLAPLGGCWWPLFIEPGWMQFLAKVTPHGWANEGFNNLMLFGARGADVIWQMVALAAFGIAFMLIAILNFRTDADAA
jgi:ABC-2 type transport system permease protein